MKYADLVAQRGDNPLWKHFEAYKIGIWSLIKNDSNSERHLLIVTGQGGIGKSKVFQDVCLRYGVHPVMMSSDTSWQQYVRQLNRFMNAHTICLDDKGNMDTAPTICEHTKGAFSGDRIVRHNIVGTDKEPAPDKEFKVTARLVWITNKKFVKKHLKSTFNALMTRGTHIDMDEKVTDSDVFKYTFLLGTQDRILEKYPDQVKVDTLNYYNEKRNWLKDITPRELAHIASIFDRDRKWRGRGGTPKYSPQEILDSNELNMVARKDEIEGLDKPLTIENGQWKEVTPNLQKLFAKQLTPKKAKTKEK